MNGAARSPYSLMLLTFLSSLPKRLNRCWRSSWLWLALAFLTCSVPARAQSTSVLCNSYLEVDVDNATGLATLFYAPCGTHTGITHPSSPTSFLTVFINNDSFYTNNSFLALHGASNVPPGTPPVFSIMAPRNSRGRIRIRSKPFGTHGDWAPSRLFRISISLHSP